MGSYASRTVVLGWLAAAVLLCVSPMVARGAEISVGTYTVNNSTNETIYVYANGGEAVSSVALSIEIGGDNGDIINPQGTDPGGPKIKGITMLGIGGVFDNTMNMPGGAVQNMNSGLADFTSGDSASSSQFWTAYVRSNVNGQTTTLGGASPQLLAVVTLDTSAVAAGSQWAVNLDAVFEPTTVGDSMGQNVPVTLIDGLVQIAGVAPEPASTGLIALSAAGLLLRRRRGLSRT